MEYSVMETSDSNINLKEWYETWFDSPYYFLLYQQRNDKEAREFIDQLLQKHSIPPDGYLLDLACGRGRHAIYLAEKGFQTLGLDLSSSNIEWAKRQENNRLSFAIHDMRLPFGQNNFDAIFNFFTSFGYFAAPEDDEKVLTNVRLALKTDGIFVLDFFNVEFVLHHIVDRNTVVLNNIEFQIRRKIEDPFIVKQIQFKEAGADHFFEEKVRLLTLRDFKSLFQKAGLTITDLYGDYQLNPFDKAKSPRLIILAKK